MKENVVLPDYKCSGHSKLFLKEVFLNSFWENVFGRFHVYVDCSREAAKSLKIQIYHQHL